MRKWMIAAGCCLFGASLTLGAQTQVSEQRDLDMDGRVVLRCSDGDIQVSAWDQPKVAIEGTLGSDIDGLDVRGDARRLVVEVRFPNRQHGGSTQARLRLQVPRQASLDLQSMSAPIHVSDVQGLLLASSTSGDIDVKADVSTARLASASGNIRLDGAVGVTDIKSVSGPISASGLTGSVQVETVSGELVLDGGGPFNRVSVRSASAAQQLRLDLAPEGSVQAESLSGPITLTLAQPADALLSLKSESGTVSAQVPGVAAPAVPNALEASAGQGRGRITLRSMTGALSLTSP